jgi:hypothetical protein
MKWIYSNERAYTLTVFGTDTYTNGADGNHKGFNTYDNTLNSANTVMTESWQNLYKGINQANAVVAMSEKINDLNPATLPIRLGEVRFLRALYYFYHIRQWGDVHLTLDETVGAEVEQNKTSQGEIYSQVIVPDLEFAIANLPPTQPDYGRATKGAAENLLGLALLTRSYTKFAASDDLTRAEELFTNVISNYTYKLAPTPASLWSQSNQKNSEIIFAVQYSTDAILNGGEGNRGHLYFLMQYDDTGMKRDIANGRPFKRFRPTDYLLNLWGANRDNDRRYQETYKHAWICNRTPNDVNSNPKWSQANVDAGARKANGTLVTAADIGKDKYAEGDTAIYIPGPGKEAKFMSKAAKDAVRYRVYTRAAAYAGDPYAYSEARFAHTNKFMDPLRPTIQWEQGSRDWFIMRLADTYLLRAEARLKLQNTTGAADDINEVRKRAAWPGKEDAMKVQAANVTVNLLLDERALELDAEQGRWFDLVRMLTPQEFVDRIKQYNPQAAPNVKTHHVRRPIPQIQIDRTLGGYEQNCGYPGGPVCQ